jgi:excisionase family DNA binding protein
MSQKNLFVRRWISVAETAELTALSSVTIRRLVRQGRIKASKIGHSVRIDKDALIKNVEANRIQPRPAAQSR